MFHLIVALFSVFVVIFCCQKTSYLCFGTIYSPFRGGLVYDQLSCNYAGLVNCTLKTQIYWNFLLFASVIQFCELKKSDKMSFLDLLI